MKFTFPKSERLCSKILIDKLFSEGRKNYSYPLKALWIIQKLPELVSVQCLISVSKRRFKRANKRNLLKRRIREAFRLNKNQLQQCAESHGLQFALIILYNTDELHNYQLIEERLKELLAEIISEINSMQNA
jgi:ribonuclease P protein component